MIYELTDITSDAPEAQMMKGSRMNLYFNKKKQKLEMNMMGGLMEIVTIMDFGTEESTMLTNIMGNKAMVKMSKEEVQKQKEKNTKPEYEITYDKSDKKQIAGYNCYKAVLKDKEGGVVKTYVTDEINTNLQFFQECFRV